jgi:hypothetical protein
MKLTGLSIADRISFYNFYFFLSILLSSMMAIEQRQFITIKKAPIAQSLQII